MSDFKSIELKNEQPDYKENCNGLYYKAVENNFINSKGEIVYSYRFRPLKRKSCSGCYQCDWLFEAISDYDDQVPIINKVEHGKTYKLQVTNFSRDWETGIIDDFEIGLVEVKNNDK